MPSIERYSAAIDPRSEPAAACSVVLAGFDAAGVWPDVLAEAWRARYPAWSDAIDAAVGISSFGIAPHEPESLGQRLGPVAFDGLGRYELLERIGQGSSGLVFRAFDHVFDACGEPSEVAVKLVACGGGDVAAALREAGDARRISHGGVARVLDAGRLDPPLARQLGCGDPAIFIVQEFVHGQPLWIWRACHPERQAETCHIMVEGIREALDACHASGISHGDLNPANVLVESGGRTRIIDFGGSVDGHEVGSATSRRKDHERLFAIRRWLMRDLRRPRPATRRGTAGVAMAVLAGTLIVATPFLSQPSRTDARKSAPAAIPDATIGPHQVFKRGGRILLVPGRGTAPAGTNAAGHAATASEPTIESVRILDPGTVTISLSNEDFRDLLGEPTGEVTPEGLTVYRMPPGLLERIVSGETASEAVAMASPASDAMLGELFGGSIFADGQEPRLAVARAILVDGPVVEAARAERRTFAAGLAAELRSLEAEGRHDSGLDALTAAAFLSADVGVMAIDHALKAKRHGAAGTRLAFATAIEAIATRRTGLNRNPLDSAGIERLAARIGAPGVAKFLPRR